MGERVERVERQLLRMRAVAQEVVTQEMERLSSTVGRQVQSLYDEVHRLRSSFNSFQEESNFSRTLNSWRSSWECLNMPMAWCAATESNTPPTDAERMSEIATAEMDGEARGEF